jgi:hypothetical protein
MVNIVSLGLEAFPGHTRRQRVVSGRVARLAGAGVVVDVLAFP